MRTCVWLLEWSPHPSLYFFLQFLFQLFLMSTLVPDEISMEDPLCDSSFGSMVTLDYVNPLTSTRTVPICERFWTDIEPQTNSPIAHPVSKRLSTLLRHGHLPREEDRAIEFWRLKDYLRNEFEHSQHWSDEMWKSRMAGGGGNKRRFQHCTDPSGEILYFRALQGHLGRNPIDPSPQDNVLIPDNFFEYIYHIGCAINLHSITNSGLILGGQNLGKERQTVFFTVVNPMDKAHKDPYLTAPRLAWYKQKHQDTVYWVDIKLAQQKGFKFHHTRCNAIILYDTLPAYCIPKVVVMESGEIMYEKESICVTSTFSKDFLLKIIC